MALRSVAEVPLLPSAHPLGHLSMLRNHSLELLMRVMNEVGDIARVRLGLTTALFVSSPQLIQELLVDRSDDYQKTRALTVFARPITGEGIFVSDGAKHRTRRALVAPALLPKRIVRYADAIVADTDRVLDAFPATGVVDVGEEMMRLTLHVVASTLFHTQVAADVERVGRSFTDASEALMRIVRSILPLPPQWPTPAGRKMMRAAAELDDVVMRIIRERRLSREDPGDLLSMLLDARDERGEGLPDDALRDEVLTLLLAGHETTANTLTWALQLVASCPDVADTLQAEVDAQLGARAPRYEDLTKLPYTLQVVKESLRLYPPAYLQGRLARVTTELGGYQLPPRQLVFVNIYGVQRRADLYERASSFCPERFAGQAERRWLRNTFMPFGAGPRICVGNHFALMEAQLVLARIAQRFELKHAITKIAEPEPLLTLRPRERVQMRLRPRVRLRLVSAQAR